MTHSSGQGEIIGKVASVALSMTEHTQAGGAGPGCTRGCQGVSRLGTCREPGAAAASPAAPLQHGNGSLGAWRESCMQGKLHAGRDELGECWQRCSS